MIVAALRRIAFLVVGVSAATAAVSALLGLALRANLELAVARGFYGVGCLLLLFGFFAGNRGPARVKSESAGSSIVPFFGSRTLRWATSGEQSEAINNSAVFIALGVILVLIGIGVDARHSII